MYLRIKNIIIQGKIESALCIPYIIFHAFSGPVRQIQEKLRLEKEEAARLEREKAEKERLALLELKKREEEAARLKNEEERKRLEDERRKAEEKAREEELLRKKLEEEKVELQRIGFFSTHQSVIFSIKNITFYVKNVGLLIDILF